MHADLLILAIACADPPGDTVRKADADTPIALPDDTGDTQAADSADTVDTVDTVDNVETAETDEPWSLPTRAETDTPGANESWRWGGGVGYPDVVDPDWPVVTRVSDLAGLTSALSTAVAGDIVWVEESAAIDLTGQALCIPGGVWLASNRGVGDGGLLYVTEGGDAVIETCGTDVRITGLRLRGPDPENCPAEWPDDCPNDVSGDSNCAYCTDTAYAISTTFDRLEVDNNELSGWTYAGVGVHGGLDADVHHNHIHHHWREGLGYGVVIYGTAPTSALIRWNRFQSMRHAVAGQGYPDEDYEARDNLVEDASISHVFDMHGSDEAADDGSPDAGGDIRVHGNIVLVPDQYSFVVRGRPETGSWFYDNCVAPPKSEAYDQRYYTGNFSVDEAPDGSSAPNTYGASDGDCGTLHWCLADGATGPQRYGSATGTGVTELIVGDMDGDGRDDVFGTTGSAWRYASPDGGTWASLATSGTGLDQLAIVDLDGDGIDDVFRASGSEWSWSRGGVSSWATLKASSYGRDEVGFGDFDGDGAIDVFTTDGSQWSYHPKGSGDATSLATAGVSIASLAFGDFDGDGITDVFYGDGSQWKWSRSGSTSWANLASSSATVSSLAFADLDGDGVTDVISVASEMLRVSWGGKTSWETLRYQHQGLDEVLFGDFDGDKRADVLTSGCL